MRLTSARLDGKESKYINGAMGHYSIERLGGGMERNQHWSLRIDIKRKAWKEVCWKASEENVSGRK